MGRKLGRGRLVRGVRKIGLPEEVIFGVPKVVLMGIERALVENHEGIVEYSLECVRVRTPYGLLEIHGSELTLAHLSECNLLVQGKITKLNYAK